jgi:hypothetical protein
VNVCAPFLNVFPASVGVFFLPKTQSLPISRLSRNKSGILTTQKPQLN